MKRRDVRKLSPSAQEAIRVRAVESLLSGKKRHEVSEMFQVSAGTVSKWKKWYNEGGFSGLKKRKQGRKKGSFTRLKPWQCGVISRKIRSKCPEQLELPFMLWTRQAIKELIKKQFGIDIPLRTISDYLKRWGLTPQKPAKSAYEQQPALVKKWLDEEYPAIAKQAKKETAHIYWGDEMGLRSWDQTGRSFSPKGKTPIIKRPGSKFSTNMISAITNQGHLRFMLYDGKMNADVFIDFLRRLIKSSDRKVFLILDNLKVHHAHKVTKWVEKYQEKIALFFYPHTHRNVIRTNI